MPTTKLKNGQLPDTISSKTVDNTNTINTTTTNLKITGGTNGQVLSTDGSGNLSWATAGGVSDGDKGDITVSSSGSTWTIDNDAITYAKIQNVSAARLLGRGPASAGDVQEISTGTGLQISGTTLSTTTAAVTNGDKGDITVSNSGATWTIDNGVVTYAKMQNVSASSVLLGRATAGSGVVEEITLGSGLSLSGATLSASSLNTPLAVVTKTADETITSSTTLQNDDHLTYSNFSFLSGVYYYIKFELLLSRTSAVNSVSLKFGFAGRAISYIAQLGTTNAAKCDGVASAVATHVQGDSDAFVPVELAIAFHNQGFTGPHTFMWAQDTSSTTGLVLRKGSKMIIWQVT